MEKPFYGLLVAFSSILMMFVLWWLGVLADCDWCLTL